MARSREGFLEDGIIQVSEHCEKAAKIVERCEDSWKAAGVVRLQDSCTYTNTGFTSTRL